MPALDKPPNSGQEGSLLWKNGILKRVRTLFQLTENDQKFSSCARSIYLPAMPLNSQDFRHNALNWDKNDSPVLGALQCGPHVVQALKSPMGLSFKISTFLPWSNQSYSQVFCANKVSPFLPLPIKPHLIKPFPSV